MREQTEWVELIENKVNVLTDADKIVTEALAMPNREVQAPHQLYGGGKASNKIVDSLLA